MVRHRTTTTAVISTAVISSAVVVPRGRSLNTCSSVRVAWMRFAAVLTASLFHARLAAIPAEVERVVVLFSSQPAPPNCPMQSHLVFSAAQHDRTVRDRSQLTQSRHHFMHWL